MVPIGLDGVDQVDGILSGQAGNQRFVANATGTVKKSLFIGAVLVVLTLTAFLGNLRTAFIVSLALPFCALIAVIMMGWQGISANLMSLGGIAIGIGMLGDGAIVMVENIFRHLGSDRGQKEPKDVIIVEAAKEVARPILFSIAIIVMVFLLFSQTFLWYWP